MVQWSTVNATYADASWTSLPSYTPLPDRTYYNTQVREWRPSSQETRNIPHYPRFAFTLTTATDLQRATPVLNARAVRKHSLPTIKRAENIFLVCIRMHYRTAVSPSKCALDECKPAHSPISEFKMALVRGIHRLGHVNDSLLVKFVPWSELSCLYGFMAVSSTVPSRGFQVSASGECKNRFSLSP